MSNSATKVSMRRLRPSPSIVISMFALLIAMSTGAYAAVTIAPENSVNSKSIKNESVKTEDLAAQAVSKGKLKKAAVNGNKILDGSVGTKDIGDGQVNGNKILDGSVGTRDIGDGQVNGAKILDGSIDTADIGDGQVGVNDISTAAKTALNHGGPAYSTHFEAGVPLPTTLTTMASLNLPTGSYVIMSKAQIDTFNTTDIIECDLGSDQSFVQGGSSHESQIVTNNLVATYAGSAGGTVSLLCRTYGGGGISQVRLTAINVSSVTNTP